LLLKRAHLPAPGAPPDTGTPTAGRIGQPAGAGEAA
jgi:hypothetical protein